MDSIRALGRKPSIAQITFCIKREMKEPEASIFEERYRVVALEGDRLLVRGIVSGQVLTIINPEPDVPLREEDYPPGKLIAITDPSTSPLN